MSVVVHIDEHEPDQAEALLSQSVTVNRTSLNRAGWADYLYATHDSIEHVERKQTSEILSDMDGVEDQLRRELLAHPENRLWLLIEGVLVYPDSMDSISARVEKNGILYQTREFRTRPAKFEYWIAALQRLGVLVVRTNNYIGTCQTLVAMAKGAQTPHTTLNRPLQPKVYHQDPQVRNLMSLQGAKVGPKLAERLVDEFGTLYRVVTRSPKDLTKVKGVGLAKAKVILRAAGRKI